MAQSLAEFYHGKRVLATGHTGFKGGWLAAWLKLSGAQVTGLSLPSDIREYSTVVQAVEQSQPEIVFHLAAQALVRRSYQEPVATYATNVMGTVHVLEAARQTRSVRAVVVVTSDKCYENREWIWGYRESEPMGGADPYSSSKGCAELVTAAYRQSFCTADAAPRIASCRAGNVIGGGDWAEDRLVPDIARAILAGEPVIIRNPGATRPWQHVLEPLRGYLILAMKLHSGEPGFAEGWNFGPEAQADLTVHELAQRIVQCWGQGAIEIRCDANAPHEAHLLRLDSSKARVRLHWHPLLSIQESIELTVDWYRSRSRDLTDEQIRAYMQRAFYDGTS